MGNHSDHLGRHVQGHYYSIADGLLPPDVEPSLLGPGVSVATTQFNHGNPGIIGGAILANDFVKLPLIFWRQSLPPDTPRWGLANKRAMRDLFRRGIDVRGLVQEIPSPDSRVTLDPAVHDPFGLPVARLSGTPPPRPFAPPSSCEHAPKSGCAPAAPSAYGAGLQKRNSAPANTRRAPAG